MITIYFDGFRRFLQVPLTQVAETIENLIARNYTVNAAEGSK